MNWTENFEVIGGWLTVGAGAVGSLLIGLAGGWDQGMRVLCILMVIDYLTGLIVAGVFHKSPKTQQGRLESQAGFKGLFRKIGMLALVIVAFLIDRVGNTTFIRDAVIIAFSINEAISILENAGLMGIWIPEPLLNAIEQLKGYNKEKVSKK